MNVLMKILGGVSILLLVCSIICGVWIKSHPGGDMRFHFILSLSTVIISLVTILLFMLRK